MKKISQKEFNSLFKAMVRLYGVIDSDEIHYLLNHYYDKITKKEIIEQLKKFYTKSTKYYFAGKIENARNKYFLISNELEDDEIDHVIKERVGKPLFIPSTKEELLKFEKDLHMTDIEAELYDELFRFLLKRYKGEDKEYNVFMITSYCLYNNRVDFQPTNIIKDFSRFGFEWKSKKDLEKFLNLWMKVANNTKMFPNKGYSPKEISKMFPAADINELQMTLGPNIKEMFRTGKLDPAKYLEELESSNIPIIAKESLKAEIKKIIAEQYNNKA